MVRLFFRFLNLGLNILFFFLIARMDLLFLCLQPVSGASCLTGRLPLHRVPFRVVEIFPRRRRFYFIPPPPKSSRWKSVCGRRDVLPAFARDDMKLFPGCGEPGTPRGSRPAARPDLQFLTGVLPPPAPGLLVLCCFFQTSAAFGVNPPPRPLGFRLFFNVCGL